MFKEWTALTTDYFVIAKPVILRISTDLVEINKAIADTLFFSGRTLIKKLTNMSKTINKDVDKNFTDFKT